MGETKNNNIKEKELKKIIKSFNFEPSYNRIIVTVNRIENKDGIITTEDALSDTQFVVASGDRARYEPGDKVVLDFDRLTVQERSATDSTQFVNRIKITPFQHDGKVYTIITDNEILGKYTT